MSARLHPFFLDSPEGRLFAVHHRPASQVAERGHVLCVPPFNEEMNRCRSMVTLQARALAEAGFGTLVIDLHGTGDSAGDFADARWDTWLRNLSQAKAWLDAQAGGCVGLLGIRLGAVLAAQFHAACADPRIALALWQPVPDGKVHLTQFMRVKIAAQMDRTDLPKETTGGMRATLATGAPVEIAGYALHPELAAAIDAARLTAHALPDGTPVLWLENVSPDQPTLSPGSQTVLAKWPGPQAICQAQTFTGPAFWQVHERVVAPQAIELTTRWVAAPGQ